MRVERIVSKSDAYRQTQYYAGEHLAYYYNPTDLKNRAKVIIKDAEGVFTRYLEKQNGQRQVLTQSTTKEKILLEQRLEHAKNEELFQRLNYKNGVHYSAAIQKISEQS